MHWFTLNPLEDLCPVCNAEINLVGEIIMMGNPADVAGRHALLQMVEE
jgi:hypothetical protein